MKNNRISRKFNRKTKFIMLVSAIAIILLTVGYATLTTNLNIGNTTASIPAGTNSLSGEVVFGTASITTSGAADAGSTVGTASGQTWNASTAVFTSSIRSIVFTAPVNNNSVYDVYLTSMQSTTRAKLSCTNGTGDNAASSDLFDNFCNNTKATYSFGGTTVECDVNRCKTTLNSYELVKNGGTSNVTLTVSTLSSSTTLPDGQISISIPGITIGFSTTVDTNLSATNYVSNVTSDDGKLSATITMASGVSSFGLSTDSSTEPTTWLTEDDNGTLTGTTWDLEYTCTKNGTYYLWAKDVNGTTTKIGTFYMDSVPATSQLISNDLNLVADIHGDNNEYINYRYVGANPDNYACFDDGNGGCINYTKSTGVETKTAAGLFRIIGVFNEDTHGVTDANGQNVQLVKLISADLRSYDTGFSMGSGSWIYSALRESLNESYLPYVLTTEQANMIATTTWHLGQSSAELTSTAYTNERGTTTYRDFVTTWTGKIGLMYPSDYGYATSGGSTCANKELYYWKDTGYETCYTNDWLLYLGARTGTQGTATKNQWTISPLSSSYQHVYIVSKSGNVENSYVSYYGVAHRPSFYLESDVSLTGGTGTSTDPYRFSM